MLRLVSRGGRSGPVRAGRRRAVLAVACACGIAPLIWSSLNAFSLHQTGSVVPSASLRRGALALVAAPLVGGAAAGADAAEPASQVPAGDIGRVFLGTYTDANHPGGTYRVVLEDKYKGERRLAKIEGTGKGKGEQGFPFSLPATVSKEKDKGGASTDLIDIDFSSTGGPTSFVGFWDKDGITFVADKNHWPKQ